MLILARQAVFICTYTKDNVQYVLARATFQQFCAKQMKHNSCNSHCSYRKYLVRGSFSPQPFTVCRFVCHGLTTGANYVFRVKAVNAAGYSLSSNDSDAVVVQAAICESPRVSPPPLMTLLVAFKSYSSHLRAILVGVYWLNHLPLIYMAQPSHAYNLATNSHLCPLPAGLIFIL